jgi:DnaJ-class molecular chaperone
VVLFDHLVGDLLIHREAHVKTCPDCNGDGVIEKGTDDEQQCPTCGGSGFVPDDDNDDEEVTRTASW